MKVIDLLNKIAKGEEVPKKIIYNSRIFKYNEYNKCYIWNCNGDEFYLSTYYRIESILNEEVEIIEEEKKIEKIGKSFKTNSLNDDIQKQIEKVQYNCALAVSKIDELIDEVNALKGGD